MSFTWLVLFVVVGLTGAWWWQNHKAQQEEITTMADQSSAELNQSGNNGAQSVPLSTEGATSSEPQSAASNTPATEPAATPEATANTAPATQTGIRTRSYHLLRPMLIPPLRQRHRQRTPRRHCQLTRLARRHLPWTRMRW